MKETNGRIPRQHQRLTGSFYSKCLDAGSIAKFNRLNGMNHMLTNACTITLSKSTLVKLPIEDVQIIGKPKIDHRNICDSSRLFCKHPVFCHQYLCLVEDIAAKARVSIDDRVLAFILIQGRFTHIEMPLVSVRVSHIGDQSNALLQMCSQCWLVQNRHLSLTQRFLKNATKQGILHQGHIGVEIRPKSTFLIGIITSNQIQALLHPGGIKIIAV